MKVLGIIKKVFIGIFAVIFFGFAITMTILLLNVNRYGVTEINGKSFIIIREKTASEKYKRGDLLLVESRKLEDINEGDEIFVYKLNSSGVVNIDFGNIGKIYKEKDQELISFENGATYSAEFIIGEVDSVYHNIGGYLSIVQSGKK